jgi:predicted rRNA pseudouridine synthase
MKDLLNFSLINIDKSAGPTSYSVSEFVKRQLGLKKTSHMGTLDPKVTGVLPVTLGRACKLAGYFIKHDKTYVGVLETHKEQDIKKLQKLIDENFSGKIKQTPPHRSAVKVQERERTVYSWKLTEAGVDGRSFLFEAKVEGGTYIRKLCSDLGDMIGGAHMGELRRTEAGIFDESTIINLFDFKSAVDKYKNGDVEDLKKMLIPAEDAIRQVLPVVEIDKCAIKGLHIGKPLFDNNVKKNPELKDGDVFCVFCGKQFIGIYRRTSEEIIFGRSEFVYN